MIVSELIEILLKMDSDAIVTCPVMEYSEYKPIVEVIQKEAVVVSYVKTGEVHSISYIPAKNPLYKNEFRKVVFIDSELEKK